MIAAVGAKPSSAGEDAPYPSFGVAWFAVVVFCVAQVISTVDRSILSLIVDPVRQDLGASEVQISLLQGLAFALFYAAVGIPLGFIADRVSRRRLLLVGAIIWSLATMAGGLAQGFVSMFASRVLVGIGEATLGPCAVSMITDLFPRSKRGWPMSVYLFGAAISGGVASLITGAILDLGPAALGAIPLLGGLAPWRIAFIACGSLGVILVVLLLLTHDPVRRGVACNEGDPSQLRQATDYFGANWRVFAPFFLSVGAFSIATNSILQWSPSSLIRGFDLSAAAVGQQLGLANIAAAVIGSIGSGLVLNAVVRRGGIRGKMAFAPLIPILGLPACLGFLAPHPILAMAAFAEIMMILPLFGAALLSASVELAPMRMKGVSVAVYSLVTIVIGATLGPLLVALLTEHVFADPSKVGLSLMLITVPALLLSSLLLLACRLNLTVAVRSSPVLAAVLDGE